MDAYLNPQPNSGAGQPPQAGAAEVPSPSQQQQQQQQQQQPAPSGTSDVAGAGAGKHAKTSPVWLYYREVPVVTEGGKNVRCTVSRTIPATGKAPERTVECGLVLTYRRQTDSRKGSGTSGDLQTDSRKGYRRQTDSRKGDLQSNLGRRKVEMMMLLKLNQQLIPGLADILQQVADLKDATAAGRRCISVIVYWLSLTVRVLLAMYIGILEVVATIIINYYFLFWLVSTLFS